MRDNVKKKIKSEVVTKMYKLNDCASQRDLARYGRDNYWTNDRVACYYDEYEGVILFIKDGIVEEAKGEGFNLLLKLISDGLIEIVDENEPGRKSFTKEEKQLIALYDKISWIARDKCGSIHGFIDKPYKDLDNDMWINDDDFGFVCIETGVEHRWDKAMFKNISFRDVQWKDEEPTSRKEILGEK